MKSLVPKHIRQAFTLIELLVVIAIIGILAALLLPAFSRAKNNASKVTDLNNLKQVMVAIHLYTTDNEDHMPLPNWDAGGTLGDGKYHAGWLYTPTNSGEFDIKTGLLWPTLHDQKVYVCPSDKVDQARFSKHEGGVVQRDQQLSTYAMNGAATGYMFGWQNPTAPSVKLAAFHPDDCAFWETDENEPYYFNDGANYPPEGVSPRHQQGGIQATFSGSVNYVRLVDWYREATNDPERNRLWCYPNTPHGGDPVTHEHE
jgi:prepilin-type N-terminal cleavage/methylation domain-containing protein